MRYITVYANTYVYDTSLHVEILTQRLLGAAQIKQSLLTPLLLCSQHVQLQLSLHTDAVITANTIDAIMLTLIPQPRSKQVRKGAYSGMILTDSEDNFKRQ